MSRLLSHLVAFPPPGIKITGSNGKGSTCAMLDAILREHELRVGLFTSPHMFDVCERLVTDGEAIDQDELLSLLERVHTAAQRQSPGRFGAFELLTATAALWFDERKVDVAIWEAGIGGRLDATRPLPARVSAVVNVSLEHTQLLGSTREAIAQDKAALVCPGTTLVLGAGVPSPTVDARLIHAQSGWPDAPQTALKGAHQVDNARCALVCAREFLGPDFDRKRAEDALQNVKWPGRMERFDVDEVPIWVDTAHNLDGLRSVLSTFDTLRAQRPCILVIGVSADRDVEGMVRLASADAAQVICTAARHKGASIDRVAAAAGPCERRPSVTAAVEHAVTLARTEQGVVLVTGGLFVAAEAISHLSGRNPDSLRFL